MDQITKIYDLFKSGQTQEILALFAGEPSVNVPYQGEIRGKESFESFAQEEQEWLEKSDARSELLALTATDERVVAELVLNLRQAEKRIDLPVAVVAELDGDKVAGIRIYHSTWPLTGEHEERPPILDVAEGLEEPGVIQAYMAGIAKPDKETVLALFTEDGYVREPSGSDFKHVGEEALQRFYDVALADGGIPLKHCTATFDGTRFAVEYVCDHWGTSELNPQAGMAVYELSGEDRLAAVRIYDDVTPPSEE